MWSTDAARWVHGQDNKTLGRRVAQGVLLKRKFCVELHALAHGTGMGKHRYRYVIPTARLLTRVAWRFDGRGASVGEEDVYIEVSMLGNCLTTYYMG